MSEREEEHYYKNIGNLAKDATNLLFQMLRDRVLRFDLTRSLEINTYHLTEE